MSCEVVGGAQRVVAEVARCLLAGSDSQHLAPDQITTLYHGPDHNPLHDLRGGHGLLAAGARAQPAASACRLQRGRRTAVMPSRIVVSTSLIGLLRCPDAARPKHLP